MLCRALIALLFAATLSPTARSQTTVLYDGSSNVTPSDPSWGWIYAGIGTVTPPGGSGYTQLTTMTSDAFQAGFSKTAPANLYASLGWRVRFDLQLTAEDHSNSAGDKNADGLSDRSGVSLIALGADHLGVELGFWNNEIWTQQQSPIFIHDTVNERAFLNTTASGSGSAGLIRYDLVVNGPSYYLYVNGSSLPSLTGQLKNYTAGPVIYNQPNFLFIGDDTTSARGAFSLSRVELTAVPESSTVAFIIASGIALIVSFRRRRAVFK